MRHHALISSIAALAVASEAAAPQAASPTVRLSPTVKLAPTGQLIATTSFTPYVAFGMLGGTPIRLSLSAVDFTDNARLDGTIVFIQYHNSAGYLRSDALPNGNYSVQLSFSNVSSPAVFTFTYPGSDKALASCSLVTAGYNTTQTCNSGTLAVADGKLSLVLGMASGNAVNLTKVTINRWK